MVLCIHKARTGLYGYGWLTESVSKKYQTKKHACSQPTSPCKILKSEAIRSLKPPIISPERDLLTVSRGEGRSRSTQKKDKHPFC